VAQDGLFLGETIDADGARTGAPVHYDPSRLTTHGVIVGMTGSGKTGLGVVMLEELLRRNIPCLILDPKGDMGNLALTFPELDAASFEPWVDRGEAEREGIAPAELATRKAQLWQRGLAGWGISGKDIAELREQAPVSIFTPGSRAGTPMNILGSLAAPVLADGQSFDDAAEQLHDEIEGFVSGLLGLIGIEADPLASREHILLSNLIEKSWRAGRSLDLAGLIGQVQNPPLRKLGVFEVESFFPAKDRLALAMRINGLLATPGFDRWLEGQPVDVGSLLWTPEGKARASVIYLSLRVARPGLHGRGLRLLSAHRRASGQKAHLDPAQASARLRRRAGALHPEPRRPRLQGHVQRGHLADRASADRARQSPHPRGADSRQRGCRRIELRRAALGFGQATVPVALDEVESADPLHHAMGHELPAWAADP
jgi:hypothetical protein